MQNQSVHSSVGWTRMLVLATIWGAALFAQTQRPSTDEINQGTADYKQGRYADAVAHFKRAVELDPANLQAQFYLATAYYIQWVPGTGGPENEQAHDLAAKALQSVLDKEPNNSPALAMMASMAFNEAGAVSADKKAAALDEAARWNQRRIAVNPNEADAYYYLGVIAWAKAFPLIQAARVELKMAFTDPGPIPDPAVRAALQAQYGATIADGITNLRKCLAIGPQREDAMAYLNLLLRKEADLEESAEAAQADIKDAEEWSEKALDLKKSTAAQSVEPPSPPPPPPPPASRMQAPAGTQRIGGRVAESNLIRKVDPLYPPLAQSARVQGYVEFTVLINEEGAVENAQLVRGHPLLVLAAKDALMQWRYRPVLLNGQPVKVLTDVVIAFSLVP